MATTTKADLVASIAASAGIKKTEAEKALEAVTSGIKDALSNGSKVTLVGFGTFSVTQRAARTGRNPRTKEPINIPASNSVKFKPGTALKSAVN
jgi:DNA-binding protein HU-beta